MILEIQTGILDRMNSALVSFGSNVWLVSLVVTVISNARHVRNPCRNGLDPVHKRVAILKETNGPQWSVWMLPLSSHKYWDYTAGSLRRRVSISILNISEITKQVVWKERKKKNCLRPVEFRDSSTIRQNRPIKLFLRMLDSKSYL